MAEKLNLPTKLAVEAEIARRSLSGFARVTQPNFELSKFHTNYYAVLELFARGVIKKLIVSIPPQHGKSLGSSILLPAYMLGLNPDLKICIASYSLSLAAKFNRSVQRIISSNKYSRIFPQTRIKTGQAEREYVRTAENFDVVNHLGGVLSVGREGPLTGNRVDVMILDDIYRDAMEANSQIVRKNAWEWYTSVVRTRLHNDSAELIVFTRWHRQDIVGLISEHEPVVQLKSLTEDFDAHKWYVLNFQAIKDGEPFELDMRAKGEALWEERHSIESLDVKRRLDPHIFEALYQGNPVSSEGLLYGDNFKTYSQLPENIHKRSSYTDTADTGDDYLCSVCYIIDNEKVIYITDVVFTRLGMEVTESAVAAMLSRNQTRKAWIESNNGGRGFARSVQALAPECDVEWFFQSANKESRILTNSSSVLKHIRMPQDWAVRWSEFYQELTLYRRSFRANRNHDAADVLTGIIEREIFSAKRSTFGAVGFAR